MHDNIKDLYNNIKTPEALLEFMHDNIHFGICGSNKKLYDTSDLDSFELASEIYWNLSSPANLLKNRYGQLFDQIELERDWFYKHKYEFKTFYITFLINKDNSYPTHAYLAFKRDNKWYWFENCDKCNYGIHEFTTLEDLITNQMNVHVKLAAKFNPLDNDILNCLHIFEYKKPKYGINTKEFTKFVLASEEVPIVE